MAGLEALAHGERGLGEVLQNGGASELAQPHLQKALGLYQRLALAMPHEFRYQQAVQLVEEVLKVASN